MRVLVLLVFNFLEKEKKMTVPFIRSNDGVITLVLNCGSYSVHPSDSAYNQVKSLLATGTEDQFLVLLDKSKQITNFMQGSIVVKDGEVLYKDKPIHNIVTQRILDFLSNGLPYQPLLAFLENLLANPSFSSQEQLFSFLERLGLCLTPDGQFLGYKAVTKDFMDKHSKTISNKVGSVVTMNRGSVEDKPELGCGKGLHVGSLSYVQSFASRDDKIIIVKVHPRDTVSVPTHAGHTKLRCCRYEVISEYTGELTRPLYNPDSSEYTNDNYDDYWDEGDVSSDYHYDDHDDDHDNYEDDYDNDDNNVYCGPVGKFTCEDWTRTKFLEVKHDGGIFFTRLDGTVEPASRDFYHYDDNYDLDDYKEQLTPGGSKFYKCEEWFHTDHIEVKSDGQVLFHRPNGNIDNGRHPFCYYNDKYVLTRLE